ncbi:NUDIX domain-containing protein [Shimia sp. R10_1]|uniref:NUDIX domain-containing protein n=1 Tax=Shimia sp. R10_1 TaxID=2821095 RepID=UPI001AD9B183|nr:NUDIX domain-containing protein [Shimia sp. R10_1]MBO9472224.1 NUDIX domain-containing protein [Shimia sp. R10_1]
MKNLFVYGTLRHVPLLEAVLGKPSDALQIAPAILRDHAVYAVQGQDFPIIKSKAGSAAEGLWLGGLTEADVARLEYYEGGFDYDLAPVHVTLEGAAVLKPAEVFKSEDSAWAPDGPWSLADWQNTYGVAAVFGAVEEMSYFGTRGRAEVDRMLPMIRARAMAKAAAQARNTALSPGGMHRTDVTDVSLRRPYAKYFALEEVDLRFRRYDGSFSEPVERAVFVATDAVILLPYDPVRDRVLLIEQFRMGPFLRGDALPWQLEPIAGRIDAAETAEDTARREAEEEAGLTIGEIHEVAHAYASPGCTTEFYDIYVGIADLPDDVTGVSGLAHEAEDIRSFLFSYEELMQMVDTMQLVNTPLVLAALWLARHRDRLRGTA